MFAAIAQLKVLVAVAAAATGIAMTSPAAKADGHRSSFGVAVSFADPRYEPIRYVPAPYYHPIATYQPVVTYAPVATYCPAPVVVRTVPVYQPVYTPRLIYSYSRGGCRW